MFGFFRKKKEEPPIVFDGPAAAFEYACTHLENRILLEAVVPALVEERERMGEEGEHYFRIRLAGKNGGRVVSACTLKEATDYPEVGEFIGFKVVRVEPEMPEPFDLLGFIALKLEPVYVVGKGWRIAKSYTPKDIKPTVRF